MNICGSLMGARRTRIPFFEEKPRKHVGIGSALCTNRAILCIMGNVNSGDCESVWLYYTNSFKLFN